MKLESLLAGGCICITRTRVLFVCVCFRWMCRLFVDGMLHVALILAPYDTYQVPIDCFNIRGEYYFEQNVHT